MALTVTTDLTILSTAESVTGWVSYGSGGAGAMAVEPDYFAQGSNCISRGVSGAATNKGCVFGPFTALDFSSGGTHAGKLIYIWMRTSTPGLCDTRAAGGVRILVGSGAVTPGDAAGVWSAWYVDGSDTVTATDGWKMYVLDPTRPPSTSLGGGVNLSAITYIGGVMRSTGTIKGQNFGVDQIAYGLGELRCRGTNTTEGKGFKEMADADFGTIGNRYGIMVEKEGVFLVKGKLVIGDGVSTNSTTFTSQDETVIWEHQTYYDGTRNVPMVPDINHNTGLPYFGMDFRGNGTGDTIVTLGVAVGSGDTASGRSGSTFIGSRTQTAMDFDDGNVEAVKIYGCTFREIRGGIDMSGNHVDDAFDGNNVIRCGTFQPGPVEVRGCQFIDCYGGAYRFLEDFKNDGAAVQQLSTADPSINWVDRLNGSNWSVPVGVEYVELLDPGGTDRSEVTQIASPDTGAGALTINVAATAGTFTRTTGSYLTDGFTVGMTVVTSGFTNGGNNATKTIKNLTATVLTVTSNTGLVDETGNNNERVIANPRVTQDSGDHFAEAVIRWPSAGASQGALGVCFRMSGTQEDYYYLKCDIVAQTITLIRCDAGADTTVDGPDAFAFAEDTDYLVHLVGNGTLIEGFVNGQKVTATSSTYQTNLYVGIRGDAEADQTGTAPRLSRFGCGLRTANFGACKMPVTANQDVSYSTFINNARATSIADAATHDYTGHSFAGNMVGIRNDSNGSVTVNVSDGESPGSSANENVGSASTTVNATYEYELTGLISGSEVRVFDDSSGTELDGTESSGTTFSYTHDGAANDIYVIVQKTNYEWLRINSTLGATNTSQKVFQREDRNYSNP